MPTLSTTTNNAFRFPTSANNGTDFATGIADLAADVDAMWGKGTLAARPASAPMNAMYWATDAKLLYQYNTTTSAWSTVMLAGAWQSLTLTTGVVAAGVNNYTPAVRLEGDIVRMKGILLNNTGSSIAGLAPWATLPSGLAPTKTIELPTLIQTGTVAFVTMPGSGNQVAATQAVPNGQYLSLDGVTYTLS